MTKTELEQAIADGIRTASRNFVSDDEITRRLNRTIRRLNGMSDLQTAIAEATIAFTGDGAYTFASQSITDFKKPIGLLDRSNNFVYGRTDKDFIYKNEDSGALIYAAQTQDTEIYINSSSSSATLTLLYYSSNDCKDASGDLQVGLSAGTDVPLLQPQYHDYLVFSTLAGIFFKERKFDDYKVMKSEALEMLRDIYDENVTREEQIQSNFMSYDQIEPSYDLEILQ